jgi:single-strand DNA-binding protein
MTWTQTTIIGRVGQDPEIRSTQSGSKIATLSLATNERWTDKHSGERKERTEWHRVVCFNERIAEIMERYVRKGDMLHITGKNETRKWTDPQGIERYVTEVVMRFDCSLTLLGSRRDGEERQQGGGADWTGGGRPSGQRAGGESYRSQQGERSARGGPSWGAPQPNSAAAADLDDEIPF